MNIRLRNHFDSAGAFARDSVLRIERVYPLDDYGLQLKLECDAKAIPLGDKALAARLGYEYDVTIIKTTLLDGAGSQAIELPAGFISKDLLDTYEIEIELELQSEQVEEL